MLLTITMHEVQSESLCNKFSKAEVMFSFIKLGK